MADKNSNNRDWSHRSGVVDATLEDFKTKGGKDALRGKITNAEGKETIIEAFSDKAKEALREAAAAEGPYTIGGQAYFTEGNVPHIMVASCNPQAEPKAELTEEEKAARAEARAAASHEAAIERDKTRVPVVEGSVAEGDSITVGGESVTVTGLGRAWELENDEQVAGLKERFPDVEGIEKGAKVQFAKFEEPSPEPTM